MMFAAVRKNQDRKAAAEEIRAGLKKLAPELPKELRDKLADEKAADAQIAAVSGAWMRSFMAYEPASALEKVACPVLALWGEKDLQVPPEQNVEPLKAALAKAGNRRVKA